MACHVCGTPAGLELVGEGAAAQGDVTVRLSPVPILRCGRGHAMVLTGVTDQVTDEIAIQLLAARQRRLRRGEVCGSCDAALILPPRRTETPVPVEVAGGVVTAVLESPMVRCPVCGREQMPAGVARVVGDVVTAAARLALDRPGG